MFGIMALLLIFGYDLSKKKLAAFQEMKAER